MDHMIESKAGKKVSEIVESEGWEAFRKLEAEIVHDLVQLEDLVVGTGGGALMFFDNAEMLKASGTIVFLDCDLSVLENRIRQGKHRPALTGHSLGEELQQLWKEREGVYRKYADINIDTTHWDEERHLEEIEQALSAKQGL